MAWKDLLVRVGMDSRGFAKGASDIKRDTQGMKNNMAQLATEMRKQRDQLKQLGQDGKGASNEYRKLKTSIAENNGAFRAMARELRAVEMAQGKVQNSTSGMGNAFSGMAGTLASFAAGAFSFTALQQGVSIINDFEQALANLRAISGATASEMETLENVAREVGKNSAFTATQVADLQTELSKLGFSVPEITKMSQSVVDLSTALGADATEAATVLGGQLRAFGVDASQAAKFAEVLGASANMTAVDFDDFALMLPKVSTAAATVGWSFSQLNATLGILRDRNIKAEQAGTSLRNILLMNAEKGLDYKETLDQIKNSTDKVAMASQIYGKENAIVALVLADTQDAAATATVKIEGMTGVLAEMNRQKLDTVQGQVTLLSSAFTELLLTINNSQGGLKSFVTAAGDAVKGITQLAKYGTILGKSFDSVQADREKQSQKLIDANIAEIKSGENTTVAFIGQMNKQINAKERWLKQFPKARKELKINAEIQLEYLKKIKAATLAGVNAPASAPVVGGDLTDPTSSTSNVTGDMGASKVKTAASAYVDLKKELQTTREYLKFVGAENEYIGEAMAKMGSAMESIFKMGGEEARKYAALVKGEMEALAAQTRGIVTPLAPLGPTAIKPPEQMGGENGNVSEIINNLALLNEKRREGIEIEGQFQNSMNQTMMMADMMGGAMGGLFERLASGYEGAGGALQGFAIEALNMAQTLISANLAVASSAIAKWAQAFGPAGPIIAAGAIAGVFGLVKGAIGKSKGVKLAKGGLAYGETMATVGDNPGARFDPEVVAPLSKLQGMLETNQTVGGQFTIRGADLVLAYDNAKRTTKAFGR
jgi:hypothetical protein